MPDLPSGTITFFFTDIEGSTALWERDRAALAQAVGRHLALLQAEVETHGGVLLKTGGTWSTLPSRPRPTRLPHQRRTRDLRRSAGRTERARHRGCFS